MDATSAHALSFISARLLELGNLPLADAVDDASNGDDGLQADERDIVAEAQREEKARGDAKPDALLREAAHVLADSIDVLSADRSLAARVHPVGTDGTRAD